MSLKSFTYNILLKHMENDEIEELQSDWVEIQSVSYYPNESQWYRNDNTVVMKDGVFTTDWTIAVSPVSNQEDLQTGSPHQKELVEGHESQQLCLSSSSGDHNGVYGEGKVEKKAGKWARMHYLESLSSAIGKIFSGIKSGAVSRASIRLFTSAATGGVGALALVLVLCMRAKKWQRQVQPESNNHLMLLLKAKDQKISQLLLQISELNDMLLARRRVPVLRVG